MIHRRRLQRREDYVNPRLQVGTPDAPRLAAVAVGGRAETAAIQGYKDTSSDGRTGLASLFAFGKRSAERNAYQQAHTTPSGVPGVTNLAVVDPNGTPIPFAPFEWNGRTFYTDVKGMIRYVERDYFQTSISMENERMKYITQMISLVAGQPSENVIALFGYDFWASLPSTAYRRAEVLYASYLSTSGLNDTIVQAKIRLFTNFSDGECSPEVMCNFGDNDPQWSKAFNKLSLLLEYHPSAIIFDSGTLNPLDSSGTISGDNGRQNAGPMSAIAQARANLADGPDVATYPDPHTNSADRYPADTDPPGDAFAYLAARAQGSVRGRLPAGGGNPNLGV